jgi:murein L,D-transpeptidase YafK
MVKYTVILGVLFMSFLPPDQQPKSFKDKQLEYNRVYYAYRDNAETAYSKLRKVGVTQYDCEVYLRAFKFEEDLEVWARNRGDSAFTLVTTYKFCTSIGELGPKRREGDKQIPEGTYSLTQFNPYSDFHLSLKVGYPNTSDRVLGDPSTPGGMIYIHGGCNTIGCIPITDEWIKELYVFCVEARNRGQLDIPIHIFPSRLTDENYNLLKKQYDDDSLINFWKQLKMGYDMFERTKRVPRVVFSPQGEYFFFEK